MVVIETLASEAGAVLFLIRVTAGRFLSQHDVVAVAGRIDVSTTTTKVHVRPYKSLLKPIRDDAEQMGDPATNRNAPAHGNSNPGSSSPGSPGNPGMLGSDRSDGNRGNGVRL